MSHIQQVSVFLSNSGYVSFRAAMTECHRLVVFSNRIHMVLWLSVLPFLVHGAFPLDEMDVTSWAPQGAESETKINSCLFHTVVGR
jgi:hypothetical protein